MSEKKEIRVELDETGRVKDIDWGLLKDDYRLVFIIPVKPRKKWWEFWKKDPSIEAINSLKRTMEMYKEEIKIGEDETDRSKNVD
jgi:hypothetical protein